MYFNIPLSYLDKASKLNICKEAWKLKIYSTPMDIMAIHQDVLLAHREYMLFSETYGIFSERNHVLGYIVSLTKYKRNWKYFI